MGTQILNAGDWMTALHFIMAMLSAWRLTELIVQDRISEPLRKRWQHYFWRCTRCVSVWAGIIAALLFHFAPMLNWPLGLSMTFLITTTMINAFSTKAEPVRNERQIVIMPDQQRVDWGTFDKNQAALILKQLLNSIQQQQPPTKTA